MPTKTYTYYQFPDPVWRRVLMAIGMWIDSNIGRLFHTFDWEEIHWRDHARWAVEDFGMRLWSWGYDGSGAELASALNDECSWQHLNDRQKAAYIAERGVPPRLDEHGYADFDAPQLLLAWSHSCHVWDGHQFRALRGNDAEKFARTLAAGLAGTAT